MSKENAKLIDFNGSPEDSKALEEVATLAQKMLETEHNIKVTRAEALHTITYVTLLALAKYLEKNKSTAGTTAVNFLNFMTMGITYRESEDGEKDGNFTPFIQPGTIFKTFIKSDEMTEDDDTDE